MATLAAPATDWRWSQHLFDRIEDRGIPYPAVVETLSYPDYTLPQRGGRVLFRRHAVCVLVDPADGVIVTAYYGWQGRRGDR